MMLMDGGDISKLVYLSILKVAEVHGPMDMRGNTTMTNTAYSAHVNVCKLFSTLSLDTRWSIIRLLGLEFIVSNGIDEVEPYQSTFTEINKKLRAAKKAYDVVLKDWDGIKEKKHVIKIFIKNNSNTSTHNFMQWLSDVPRVLAHDVDKYTADSIVAYLARIGLVGRLEER